MNRNRIFILTVIHVLAIAGTFVFAQKEKTTDNRFISYIVGTKKQDVKFYWKDDKHENFKSIQNLKTWLDATHQKLVFAMNGGMYKQDNSPQGIFVDNKKQ